MSASHEDLWRKYDAMEARLAAPLTARMLALAELDEGMRVLDLATGRGEPALPAAHRVGPKGHVLGVDVGAGVLELARERAAREGLRNVELRVGDAASIEAREPFDVVLSRWGIMFMSEPVAVLRRVAALLQREGRLVAAVWAEPARVPWFSLSRAALALHVEVAAVDESVPGAFHYASQERLDADLRAAGLEVAHVEELDVPILELSDEELIAWARAFGMSKLLEGLADDVQRAWEQDFVRMAEPHRSGGLVRLGGVTRIVVARRAR